MSSSNPSGGPSPPRTQSSVCKLWLIICKTVKFQLANTLTSVIIIGGPILVFFIYSATVVPPRSHQDPQRTYPTVNFTTKVPNIYYSPTSPVVDEIIKDVAREVGAKYTKGFASAAMLENALVDKPAFVGIEFEDSFNRITSMPAKVSVALRYPMQLRTIPKMRWEDRMYFKNMYLGTDYYLVESFLMVQAKLSEALIRAKRENAVLPEVKLKYFPERSHLEGAFMESQVSLSGFLFLPFAISSAYLAQIIIEDKPMWAMMRLMRVRGWVHWLSWFIVAFLLFLGPIIFLVLLLKWRFYRMSNVFLVLFFFCVYVIELLSSALMITAIFSDSIGVQMTILFFHVTSWLPWRLMVLGYQVTASRIYFTCLFLNSSLALGLQKFIEHENLLMGMQWNMIFKKTDSNDPISLGIIMIIMLLGTVVRILIMWYVEELKGVKGRKWYFLFQPSFWCKRRVRKWVNDIENQDLGEGQDHEPLSHRNRSIIIKARNLVKIYNGQKVVSDVSLNFYQNEITVFLGHNDSGKTTIFRMLAGFEEPNGGHITINGFDLSTQDRKALRSMSICPQENMFFDKLKVRWHMKFYCRLHGMNRKEASAEADKYLEIAHMTEYASKAVNELSSGFKRMLALCCTLCGHPTVVVLDQPGTSMDPLLRREMWDMLRRERKGRCIIMSTHNMLEAEVVADRVVVLCRGEVKGYGTPGFLTHIADSGAAYILICTKRDTCLVAEVSHFLQIRFPDIQLFQEYGIYVTYKLPAKDVSQYSQLFYDLEQAIDDLFIKEFSVRAPTLGDIFLRIGVELQNTRESLLYNEGQSRASPMTSLINLLPSFEVREDDYNVKCRNQCQAIIERKIIFMCRHRRLFLLIILMPVFIATGLILFEIFLLLFSVHSPGAINITDLPYSSVTLVLESKENDAISDMYTENARQHGVDTKSTEGVPLGDYIMKQIKRDQKNYYRKIAAGVTIDQVDKSVVAWANQKLEHGSALSLGLLYESLALALAQLKIEIVNKPHVSSFKEAARALSLTIYMDFAFTVMFYLVVVTAIFAVMPVTERHTSLQHQQLASGMTRVTYWMSHLFFDFCAYITMIPMLIIVAEIARGSMGPIAVLLLSFGFSVICFTYLVCLLTNDLGKMFSIMMYVNMIGVLSLFIHPHKDVEGYKILEYILMAHPHYALFNGVQDMVYIEGNENSLGTDVHNYYNIAEIKYMLISGIVYLMMVLLSWIPRRINYVFKWIRNEKIWPAVDEEDVEVNRIRQRLDLITTKNFKSYPLIMKNVSKRYGDLIAVRALTLDINPFECVCLLGRNGAGKSSTFYMIVGKRSVTAGTLHIKGYSIKTRSKKGLKHLGFCPHEEMLSPYMTGWETLRFFCLINGIRQSHIQMVVKSLAESFSLGVHMNKPISTYSNGTKRKLMVAVAALAPTLLCLDEPTAGVDMYAKYEIWDILDSLRKGGLAIFLTTNSMEECEIMATNTGILDRGTLLCYGSIARLRSRFDKGIFVKIKVGTIAELNILRAESGRLTHRTREGTPHASRSTLASLKYSLMQLSMDDTYDEKSTSSEMDIREDYESLLNVVEDWFMEDHPYSIVYEKYSFRGMITFVIPKEDISWAEIFAYMEDVKIDLQIMHYSISHTGLEDVFLEFVREHNNYSMHRL
ncbi:hypothetical protein KR038_008757 [Drosophila bunnanda]|nr:hypothetical protein KR038_008757 [Drosophila bunnanda]